MHIHQRRSTKRQALLAAALVGVAKDRNYMAAWEDRCVREACKNDLTYSVALKGDELRLTLPAALGATAQVAILHRVE